MKQNIILDLCGGTGSWSKPFKKGGFRVINIDLKDGWDVTLSYVGKDNKLYIKGENGTLWINADKIFGVLAAPPCPMFSFARTNAKEFRDLRKAFNIVQHCLWIIYDLQFRIKKDTQKKPPLRFWALENPNGMLKWFLGKPALEFSPYEYGDDYKKKTHIWGCFNIPKKINKIKPNKPKFDKLPTKEIHPEYYGKLTRRERRAITPKGFATAFYKANRCRKEHKRYKND